MTFFKKIYKTLRRVQRTFAMVVSCEFITLPFQRSDDHLKGGLKLKFLLLTLLFVLVFSCTENVSPPPSMRLNYHIIVKDTSGLTEAISGDSIVTDAKVFANSISYQNYVEQQTNADGQAVLKGILPDVYNFSVTRRYDEATVEQATGQAIERVLNGQIQNVDILDEDTLEIYINPVAIGELVFCEIYYNGSPANPIPYYFHDQFTELYNNSNDTIYLDSLIIADVEYGYAEEDYIHAVHAYMFPGTGRDYPLAPGEFSIVAQDAIDHTAVNEGSVDLTDADFEYFVPDKGDVNAEAENMIQIHHKYGNDFLYSVMSNALVILKVDDPYSYGYDDFERILLPKSAVLDAMEYRDNLSELDYKRLDPSLDAGLTGGFEMYSGKSVQRKIDRFQNGRMILMDNNNSSIDFEPLEYPTPGYVIEEGVE